MKIMNIHRSNFARFTFLSCLTLLLGALYPPRSQAQEVLWDGPEISETGWVHTGDEFLGWVWAGTGGDQNWIFSLNLEDYLYLPAHYLTSYGTWAYTREFAKFEAEASPFADGWFESKSLGGWLYASPSTSQSARGWIYLWNTNGMTPLRPADILLSSSHTANFEASSVEETYQDAKRISPAHIARFADYDEDIEMTTGPEGVTFTNTNRFAGANPNRFIRIGFHNESGYFDLTELENVTGKIGIDVHADVDMTETTNGFYVRVKRDDEEIAAYDRLPGGVLEEDIVLETYMTNYENNGYVEITLPWQASITIKNIYLYMENEIKGFADMEETITGGAGATAENTHTVTNATEFAAALQTAEQDEGAPTIINVDGTITYEDWVDAGQGDEREAQINEAMSNISIIGVGENGVFDGLGMKLQGRNILIQNLTLRYVLGRDALQVNDAQYVMIDHCTLHNEPMEENSDKDKFDELISIKNNAQHVIVSWNHLYDSHKTILVGSNDEVDALPDRRVIFHHNWFQDSGSRHPLFRGGHAHIYNNYYQNIDSGINVRTNSKILIENNYFENMGGAIGYWFDPSNPAGLYELNGNIFDNVDGDKPTESTVDMTFEEDYDYTLDPAEDVPTIIMDGSGAGNL